MSGEILTLTQHIMHEQREHALASGEFSGLLSAIALAAKNISREVNRAGLGGILGRAGHRNVQGEEVQKLDEYAQATFVRVLGRSGHVALLGSEEEELPIGIDPAYRGKYVVAFDPLDGSSNIEANVNVGTIFSIFRRLDDAAEPGLGDLLQPARALVAAGYVVYGPSTMFVYSAGEGVHGFTLDPSLGEFLVSHERMRMPARGKYYSVNEGNAAYWEEGYRRYVEWVKVPDAATGRPYGLRYVGSMIADFHRTLLYGGVFFYPEDSSDPQRPRGKLRLLYEVGPLAFLCEQAGGAASDGRRRVLDIVPTGLHQRVGAVMGSRDDVARVEAFVRGEGPGPGTAAA